MQELKAIKTIDKVFPTQGSMPVLALCNDSNYHICKYDDEYKLFNEYFACEMLKLWEIYTPQHSLVLIKDEQIESKRSKIKTMTFQNYCFGSSVIDAQEVNFFSPSLNEYEITKLSDKEHFLKIALFDLWICNVDRTKHNFNLLYQRTERGNQFVPIDHSEIFDGNRLFEDWDHRQYIDTLLNSHIAELILKPKTKIADMVKEIEQYFYICVQRSLNDINNIVDSSPTQWGLNKTQLKTEIIRKLSNKDWIDTVLRNFKNYIELTIR